MKEEIKIRIKRAEDALKAAELSLEHKLYLDAISRSYYSVFNAIISLFLHKDFSLPKTHSGVIAVLWENRKKLRNILSTEDIKKLHKLLQLREESDYAALPLIGKREAVFAVRFAKKILKKVKKHVSKNG